MILALLVSFALAAEPTATPTPVTVYAATYGPATETIYEYRLLQLPIMDFAGFEKDMNELAKDGWRVTHTAYRGGYIGLVIMERRRK